MTSFFSAVVGPIWIKCRKLVQNDMLHDCSDVVEIETRCRIPIWRTFGRIQWHVIPELPATLQGAATWRIQCHDPRATCHIAGLLPPGEFNGMSLQCPATLQGAVTWRNQCHDHDTLQGVIIPSAILKIVFRHILSNAVWALMSSVFCIISDTLVSCTRCAKN